MAFAVVGLCSCEKDDATPSDTTVTTDTPTTPSDTTATPPMDNNPFAGDWDLAFAEGTTVHFTLTPEGALTQTLNISPVDNDLPIAGSNLDFLVEPKSGNQVDITGSMTLDLNYQNIDPIGLTFNTTGTVTDEGLAIDRATISKTITVMSMPINLTGTISFVQPAERPTAGELTVEMATLNINGNGSLYTGSLTLAVTGSHLQATGPKSETDPL